MPLPPTEAPACAQELEALGFFNYTFPVLKERARGHVIRTGYLFDYSYGEVTGRHGDIDTEDIYEQGVQPFFDEIKAIPPCEELLSSFQSEQLTDDLYTLHFNDIEVDLWNCAELWDNPNKWTLTGDRAVRLINALFQRRDSLERMYYCPAGNDSEVIVLTEEMMRVWERHGGVQRF